MDVYLESDKVTGGNGSTPKGWGNGDTYDMELKFTCTHREVPSGFNVDWYFENDPSDQERGTWGSYLNIENENNFTASLRRSQNYDEPHVTADMKYQGSTVCKVQFIAID